MVAVAAIGGLLFVAAAVISYRVCGVQQNPEGKDAGFQQLAPIVESFVNLASSLGIELMVSAGMLFLFLRIQQRDPVSDKRSLRLSENRRIGWLFWKWWYADEPVLLAGLILLGVCLCAVPLMLGDCFCVSVLGAFGTELFGAVIIFALLDKVLDLIDESKSNK